jgi:hypothetical protein
VQKFNCKSIGYKPVFKNTSFIIWLEALLAVTFAARSKKRIFNNKPTGWRGKKFKQ